MRPVFLLVPLLMLTCTSKASDLSDQEKAAIPLMRSEAKRSCIEASETRRAEMRKKNAQPYRRWAVEAYLSDRFCDCSAERYLVNPTSADINGEYSERDRASAKQIANLCVFEGMRTSFPKSCVAIAEELGIRRSTRDWQVADLCKCIQTQLSEVPEEQVPDFLMASGEDYLKFQSTGAIPSATKPSFFSAARSCGIAGNP